MLIKFWLGITLAFALAVLLIIVLAMITKKIKGNGAIGGLIGFFLGFAIVVAAFAAPRHAYVVTGNAQYDHYMVFGSPDFVNASGTSIVLDMSYDECYIINETDVPVVVEEAVYGGYGFGGDTHWVDAGGHSIMPGHKIDYFYDDEPPSEISVRDDSEETLRLWLRNKRD